MVHRIGLLVGIFITFTNTVFSQGNVSLNDSVNEIIIYEYDTVYLDPVTIRLTDTIYEKSIKQAPVKKKNKFRIPPLGLFDRNSFLSIFTPDFFSLSVEPGIGKINNQYIPDSLKGNTGNNTSYMAIWNYKLKKYVFSFGVGFNPYHEKLQKTTFSNSSNFVDYSTPFDSLLITSQQTYNYYFNYLQGIILFGREWEISDKLICSLNFGCIGDILVGYKQGNTEFTKKNVRKTGLSVYIAPRINYKINEYYAIFISPSYRYLLSNPHIPPFTYYQKYGVGFGLHVYFK